MRHVKTVEVAGHIIAADGRPATHAYVQLYVNEAGGWGDELNSSTEAKGEFRIKGVPPGSYTLRAQQHDEDSYYVVQQKLEAGSDNIESVVIAFAKGTILRGRIVAASASATALDQIRINLEPTSEKNDVATFTSARAKQDGSFQITDVLEGTYAVHVYGMEQGWYVKSARLGGEDVLQKGLELEKGASGETLEIVISPASAQLEGSVSEDDKPAAGAEIQVKPEPETPYNRMRSRSGSTDQNGRFIFNTLPPGKYRITAKLASASSGAPATTSEPKTVTLSEHDYQTVQLTLASPQSE